MATDVPLWVQNIAEDIEYEASRDRRLITAVRSEGVVQGGMVRQRALGATFTVDIDPMVYVIDGDDDDDQWSYLGSFGTENRSVAAGPGSGFRYDLVVVQVRDPQFGGLAGSNTEIRVVTGDPQATLLLAEVPPVPPSAIPLAIIGPLTAATPSITNGLIIDARLWSDARQAPGSNKFFTGPYARVPNGWLPELGQLIPNGKILYPNLADMIGNTFNVGGEGPNDLRLADSRGRGWIAPDAGAGRVGFGNINTLYAAGGVDVVTLDGNTLPTHNHDMTHGHASSLTTFNGAHQHGMDKLVLPVWSTLGGFSTNGQTGLRLQGGVTIGGNFGTAEFGTGYSQSLSGSTQFTDNHQHAVAVEAFGGTTGGRGGNFPHQNMPPYLVKHALICVG